MKRSTLCLLALLVAAPAAAQNTAQRPSHSSLRAASRTTQHARDAAADVSVATDTGAVPSQTPPTPPTPPTPTPPGPTPAICCCRVWSHGWQYSWRPNTECTAQSGSCVTPDHC